MTPLTPSRNVDLGALAGLFRATTNAYKYLFFQSLLSVLRHRERPERFVDLDTLAVEMLALAYQLRNYFRLFFGPTAAGAG